MNTADTALWIAAARARESARPDRLFDDPWADALAGDTGRAMLDSRPENAFLPIRTRFFDDVVRSAGWATQLVLLGAGMDTRAYRLALPATTVVHEIDQPGALAAKDTALAGAVPTCRRVSVEADLAADWSTPLLAAGFDVTLPTVWLAEGLLFYLSQPAVTGLLAMAAALSGARAVFAADTFGTGLLRLPSMAPLVDHRRATGQALPFCTDEPADLFRDNGWPESAITEPGQSGANHGRLTPIPDTWSGGPDPTMRTYLVVARNFSTS